MDMKCLRYSISISGLREVLVVLKILLLALLDVFYTMLHLVAQLPMWRQHCGFVATA